MIISTSLTVGQVTFVLRVAIQILSYVGLFIVNVLILENTSRVGSLNTHDLLNRIVGSLSVTISSFQWLRARLRRKSADSSPRNHLFIILSLSLSYTIFVSLSDIGFLGFQPCSTSGSSLFATPASIDTAEKARALMAANMINGTDPSNVNAYRCNSASLFRFDDGKFLNICDSWKNGTYAESAFFNSLNSTDSDALMPLQLTTLNSKEFTDPVANAFSLGFTAERVKTPTIERGLAIVPHETGVTAVTGVPQLGPNTKIKLSKTLAIELDVGCMTLGVTASNSQGGLDSYEYFHTNDSWRHYTGPDYMESVLSKTVDDIRAYLGPFFNFSDVDSKGFARSLDSSSAVTVPPAAFVGSHSLPENLNETSSPGLSFERNCSQALQARLGLFVGQIPGDIWPSGTMCTLLALSGTRSFEGEPFVVRERMICAGATQVNMIAATVQVDALGSVSLDVTRLPSDLTYVQADYGHISKTNQSDIQLFERYERFILSDNASSPTRHFVRHVGLKRISEDYVGQGAAGNVISYMGDFVLFADLYAHSLGSDLSFASLALLDEGFNYAPLGSDVLTKWMGQVGGSYILGSLSYNGWAALQAAPVEVVSTGGRIGSCYNPIYALGFAPLILSTAVIIGWAVVLILRGSWIGYGAVKVAYGGIFSYMAAVAPGAPMKETLTAWESSPHPHLQLVSKESPLVGETGVTAFSYLKSSISWLK